ncbi:hypothetical protein [Streptomyces sp. CB03911]|uniref:hypothetical protein n=1 Tax=Streptomycetaceae TaxID=2062 RepID=UPI00093EBE19|nr:hypothetical protein [Streptomyces sp. CB03911]OKI18610.1 hypothetical protein A6A07_38450 [Streptomyces sp. CB03911]
MKKRSMLAVASLAAGVLGSLLAPSAHAGTPEQGLGTGTQPATSVLDTVTEDTRAVVADGSTVTGQGTLQG